MNRDQGIPNRDEPEPNTTLNERFCELARASYGIDSVIANVNELADVCQ